MDTERIDLLPLDPTAHAERWERMIQGIMLRARPELARRASAADPFELLRRWARPMLAASSLAAALAAVALTRLDGSRELRSYAGMEDALHLPDPVASWLADDHRPTITDIVMALEQE